MTTLALPRAERPAERAKGTVSPSESPMVASDMMRVSKREGAGGSLSSKMPSLERRGSSCGESEEELETLETLVMVPISRSEGEAC